MRFREYYTIYVEDDDIYVSPSMKIINDKLHLKPPVSGYILKKYTIVNFMIITNDGDREFIYLTTPNVKNNTKILHHCITNFVSSVETDAKSDLSHSSSNDDIILSMINNKNEKITKEYIINNYNTIQIIIDFESD